jgi:hypothetical protein
MLLHKFKKARGWKAALTTDRTGTSLPADGQPWIYEKDIDINPTDGPRIGASSTEIIQGVLKDGYFLWPVSDDA